MKLLRRIGAFLLSATILMAAAPGLAEENAVGAAQPLGEKGQVLQALGVIPAEFDAQANMTRGRFAQAVANMIGGDQANKTTAQFIDVDSRTPELGAIAVVTELGYMGGYTDGSFRPDDPILMVDATKVLLAVLGYQTEAELSGGYPMGYLITGSSTRLLSGVQGSVDEILTGAQLVQMIYNTFDIDLRYQKEYGGKATYATDKGNTFWSERRNIYRRKGTVSANAYTHIASGNGLGEGWIQLDNLLCGVGSSGIENYLGYQVQAYIHQDLSDDEGTVLAFEYQRYNSTIQVQSDDVLDGTTLRSVEYTTEGKKQRMPVSQTADLIYNGKAFRDASDRDMKPENGMLTLIDRGNDGVADVVWIDSYVNYAVLGVNMQNESISDHYDQPILKLEDMDYTITRDGFREDLMFIKEWEIVSAAVSLDGTYAKLVVASESFSGAIDAMGDGTVTIGGTEYDVASSQAEPMKVGDVGTFYLDMFGKVAAFRKDVSEEFYAYLVRAGVSGALESELQFKLFDVQSSTEQVYTAANNLTVDGKKMNGLDAIAALEKSAKVSSRGKGVAQLIRYRKNSKGEINAVDTVIQTEHENDNSMELSMANTESDLVFKGLLFSGKAACGPNTKVVVIPPDIERIKDFSVTGKGYFSYDGRYRIEAYCMEDDLIPEVLLVYPEETGGTGNISIYYGTFTVDQLVRSVNQDDEGVVLLKGVMEGAEVAYEVDEDLRGEASQLKFGDVIAIERTGGRVTAIKRLFDIDNPLAYGMDGGYTDKNVMTFGKAMYKSGNVLVLGTNDDLTEKVGFEISRVTVVDKANKKIRTGSADDIVTYGETKDRDSSNDILIYSYYGTTKDIVVFETE